MKEINIVKERKSLLLNRTKIIFQIAQRNEPVPSRIEVRDALANKLKKDKDLILITKIVSDFGTANVNGEAVIYDSKENMQNLASAYFIKRIKNKEDSLAKSAQEEKKTEEKQSKSDSIEEKEPSSLEISKEDKSKAEEKVQEDLRKEDTKEKSS